MTEFTEDIAIVALNLFDAAFPVSPSNEERTKQRFMTLFEHESHTRHGRSASVSRVTNLYGETFALKRLHVSASKADTSSIAPESTTDPAPSTVKELRSSYASGSGQTPYTSGTPDYVTRGHVSALYEEYRVHQVVSHLRGYPKLYGFGLCDNDPVILMEWVAGASLHDALNEYARPLPLTAIADFGIAVLTLLERTTELDETFVHRDLSPRNIILRTDQKSTEEQFANGVFDICLVDFGSSSLNSSKDEDPTFTSQHNIWRMGTPAYAPPEMLSSDIELPRTWRQSQTIDTYALSSILYELYAGRRPYPKAPDDPRSIYRLKTEEKPDPLELRDPDGGALAGIIATGLSAQQEDRPTVVQMKAALENWKRMPAKRQISGLRGTKRADAAFWQPGYARKAVARRSFIAAGIVAAGALVAGGLALPKMLQPRDAFEPNRYTTTETPYDGSPLFKAFDGQHPGWMLCADDGSIVCKPDSSRECGALREGLVALFDDASQRFGYITPAANASGYAWFILPSFALARDFAEGRAAVQDRETMRWGFIDSTGSWTVTPQFRDALPYSHGVAAVQTTDDPPLWGAIDLQGSWVVKPAFKALGSRSANGHAVAQVYDAEDTENSSISARASDANPSSGPQGNDAGNESKVEAWGIVDARGSWSCAPQFESLRSCAHGPAPARDSESKLWGFVGEDGSWVIRPLFRDARPFYPDSGKSVLAAVQDERTQLWYFIDLDGSAHGEMPPRFWKLGDLHDGLAPAQASAKDSTVIFDESDPSSRVRGAGKRYGYVDAAGKWHLKRLTTLVDAAIGPAEI